jgi:hypothetical protein
MSEILQFVDTGLRVVLALVFLVSPGIVFWLVVSGLVFMIRRLASRKLCRGQVKGVATLSGQPSGTS